MRNQLMIVSVLLGVCNGFAQGTVRNVNNVTGFLRARIYGPEPGNSIAVLSGNSPDGTPAGTTVYGGLPLAGTGFTIQLWGIGGTTTEASSLQLATGGTSFFRSGSAAGIWNETAASIPNAPGGAGSHATLQIRVWDNQAGTINSWAEALARRDMIALGTSELFGVDNLGDGGATPPPVLVNLRSFNISFVPEPSATIMVFLACGLGILVRRFNQ